MKIEFYAVHRVLIEDERTRPRRISEVAPDWKSKIPVHVTKGVHSGKTVRACPGIDDFLHLGFMIPLWSDVILTRVTIDSMGRMAPDLWGANSNSSYTCATFSRTGIRANRG